MPSVPNDPELFAVRRDSTIGRAPVRAVSAPSKKRRIMRAAVAGMVSARKSRISDRQDFPLGLRLTGGQRHPPPHPGPRPEPWGKPGAALLSRRIADRAYDGEAFRAWLAQRGLQAFIPARARRRDPPPYDLGQYFVTFQLGTSF